MNIVPISSIKLGVKFHGKRVHFHPGKNFILNLLFYVFESRELSLGGVISSPRLYAEAPGILDSHLQRMNSSIGLEGCGRETENVREFRNRIRTPESLVEIVIPVKVCPASGVAELIHESGDPNRSRWFLGSDDCRKRTLWAFLVEVTAGRRGHEEATRIESIDNHVGAQRAFNEGLIRGDIQGLIGDKEIGGDHDHDLEARRTRESCDDRFQVIESGAPLLFIVEFLFSGLLLQHRGFRRSASGKAA